MTLSQKLTFAILPLFLTACALTPAQKAAQEARRIKAQQALQVDLAKQCDAETAELMQQQFNPPIGQTEKEKAPSIPSMLQNGIAELSIATSFRRNARSLLAGS